MFAKLFVTGESIRSEGEMAVIGSAEHCSLQLKQPVKLPPFSPILIDKSSTIHFGEVQGFLTIHQRTRHRILANTWLLGKLNPKVCCKSCRKVRLPCVDNLRGKGNKRKLISDSSDESNGDESNLSSREIPVNKRRRCE
ncbi:uncharacterized protein LOC107042433 [Diachasma alloeum]|uniref:uncharacterized protein LOC107042433 n=1 Tax=Diachasma alloeum TaxID=454923 RepID=UPI0010FB3F9E|nr:uncharacterized protein LOC107042433 [Diachasma alloeum]